MRWDNSGIAVFFFPRNSIPSDITAGAPVDSNWGTPSAFWPATSCNPFQFFQNHAAIFDTTLCGDWAGSVWTATGVPGQEQSCAQRTGVATCDQFVQQNGASFSEACACVSLLWLRFMRCNSEPSRLTLEQIGKSRVYRSIRASNRKEPQDRFPLSTDTHTLAPCTRLTSICIYLTRMIEHYCIFSL